jgi:branched-chain amino acid aminotransferase
MPIAYYDGQFVERATLKVNPADFGFARGIALFELGRVYGGKPFHLMDHLERLAGGAQFLGVELPLTLPALAEVSHAVIVQNALPQSAIKYYLTAGECGQPSGTSFFACTKFTPHLMVMEDAVTVQHPEAPYGLAHYQKGQCLKTVPYERELPNLKSTNYMLGYYAARKVAGAEWDDILFTHRDGYITEATRSNFFCVIDGVLVTPQRGMLLGITRKIVLQLAKQLGLVVSERDLRPEDLAQATEAFTTGSIAEIMPVGQIDGHKLPHTMDGVVFKALRRAFTDYSVQCV